MTRYSMFSVWCTAMLLLAVAGADGLRVLELVHIVHRAGVAPPEMSVAKREKMCSPDSSMSCRDVESAGLTQSFEMARYIKKLYEADTVISGASSWFTLPYSAFTYKIRALGEPILLRAADKLFYGLYPFKGSHSAIFSSDPSQDTVFNEDANPSVAFASEARKAAANKQLEALVDEQFPDSSVLAAMGAEVGLDTLCSSPSSKVACCVTLQELTTIYSSTLQTTGAPTVMANADKLQTVAAAYRSATYGYNQNDSHNAARGSLGYALADMLLVIMRGKMLAPSNPKFNSAKVVQYAHRTSFATAIGFAPSGVVPVAETFIIDLLRDDATNAYFVRLRSASIITEDIIGGKAAATVFPFRCTNANGEHTDATTVDGITCPFEDFARFVQSTRGTSAAGADCFLDEATREEMGCQVEGRAPSDACVHYRAMCPGQACQSGTVYVAKTGICMPLYWKRDMINGGVMAAICTAVAFGGFMLAIIFVEVLPFVRQRWAYYKEGQKMHHEPID